MTAEFEEECRRQIEAGWSPELIGDRIPGLYVLSRQMRVRMWPGVTLAPEVREFVFDLWGLPPEGKPREPERIDWTVHYCPADGGEAVVREPRSGEWRLYVGEVPEDDRLRDCVDCGHDPAEDYAVVSFCPTCGERLP